MQPVYKQRLQNNHTVPAWKNVVDAQGQYRIGMVRDNVMKVEIRPYEQYSTQIEESEAYPAITFFSNIGGILGLYLGMSLLSVFEALQSLALVWKSFTGVRKEKRLMRADARIFHVDVNSDSR